MELRITFKGYQSNNRGFNNKNKNIDFILKCLFDIQILKFLYIRQTNINVNFNKITTLIAKYLHAYKSL